MIHTIIIEKLFQLAVASIMLERALAFVFEIKFCAPRWNTKAKRPAAPMLADMLGSTLKALITVGSAGAVCWAFQFDVLTPVLLGTPAPAHPDSINLALTALIVAGGSAGSIKLFQDVLGLSKVARDASREAREAELETRRLESEAKQAEAHARIASAEAVVETVTGTGANDGAEAAAGD